MKKIGLLICLALLIISSVSAQVKWGDYMLRSTEPGEGIRQANISVSMPANQGIDWSPEIGVDSVFLYRISAAFKAERSEWVSYFWQYDTSTVYFYLTNTTEAALDEYEFRVLKNKNTVVTPWSKVKTAQNEDFPDEKAGWYLSSFQMKAGSFVIVDIRKKNTSHILATTIVTFKKIRPELYNIYTADDFPAFVKRLAESSVAPKSKDEVNKWKQKYPANEIDSFTHLPKKLVLQPDENDVIFFLNIRLTNKNIIEYALLKDGAIYKPWQLNEFDKGFVWLRKLPPGNYVLKVRYTLQPNQVLEYSFEVKKAWQQTTAFKIIAVSLIAVFFALLFLLFWLRRQQQWAAVESLKKAHLALELQSLQSQLNPHFVFNAMSSIQGLINTNRIEDASQYLSSFGNLLRSSLNNNRSELVALQSEINLLHTYIKLEQLRFGFEYNLFLDEAISASETDFPPLLLQPLVENAVKHGINGTERGIIEISFRKMNNNFIVVVRDNGKGFQADAVAKGHGIKLTEERIQVLNQWLPDRRITMNTESEKNKGTTITLTFINWLL